MRLRDDFNRSTIRDGTEVSRDVHSALNVKSRSVGTVIDKIRSCFPLSLLGNAVSRDIHFAARRTFRTMCSTCSPG
jgi:hypothetical protein